MTKEVIKKNLFSSEFVSIGHPDKLADQISDAMVDVCLAADPNSRVACEVLATDNNVFVGGEVRVPKELFDDLDNIVDRVVRDVFRKAGYTEQADILKIVNALNVQSSDIALGVDADGAGDQGMMFGYAVKGFNPELMPLEYSLARDIILCHEQARLGGGLHGWLKPDAKSQVTVDRNTGKVEAVVLSTQHSADADMDELEEYCIHTIIGDALYEYFNEDITFFINPTGRFVTGGTVGDAGLTGRKIIVDTYGGVVPHGGGAFSGKDSTKVDRSGAYMARYIAKNIVASGITDECSVQLAYAIGVAEPVGLYIDAKGLTDEQSTSLTEQVREQLDLTPRGIINLFNLREPKFFETSQHGHFGHPHFAWEQVNLTFSI